MNNETFLDLIKQGDLEACKKYYDEFKLDIHDRYDLAFRHAAENGHLDICKWLYSLGANIAVHHSEAFKLAAINCHLNVCKWIYRKSVSDKYIDFFDDFYYLWSTYQKKHSSKTD